MNNLVLDIGNTKTKIGLFHDEDLMQEFSYLNEEIEQITLQTSQLIFDQSIIAATEEISLQLKDALAMKPNSIVSENTKVPISIQYQTKSTLGNDRKAAVCGARAKYKSGDLLVITAGTCITYNLLNRNNEFLGGAISPGLHMRYQAMNAFTDQLPLVSHREFDKLIGQSTEESLLSGAQQGVIAEVDGIIEQYQLLYPNLKVIICGGDTFFLERRLKNAIFAHSNLILHGLNTILRYNLNE